MRPTIPLRALATPGSRSYMAPTAANFPALKHAFLPGGVSGHTLADSVGNVVLTNPTAAFLSANGLFTPDVTAHNAITMVGQWATVGSHSVVIIAVGPVMNASATVFSIGDTSTGAGIDVATGGNAYAAYDYDNYIEYATRTANPPLLAAATCMDLSTPNNVGKSAMYICGASASGATVGMCKGAGTMTVVAPRTSLVGFELPTTKINMLAIQFSGIWIFMFDVAPVDVQAAAAWMGMHPGQVYPGWAGRT